jgi:hypothetical protein
MRARLSELLPRGARGVGAGAVSERRATDLPSATGPLASEAVAVGDAMFGDGAALGDTVAETAVGAGGGTKASEWP